MFFFFYSNIPNIGPRQVYLFPRDLESGHHASPLSVLTNELLGPWGGKNFFSPKIFCPFKNPAGTEGWEKEFFFFLVNFFEEISCSSQKNLVNIILWKEEKYLLIPQAKNFFSFCRALFTFFFITILLTNLINSTRARFFYRIIEKFV